MQTDVLIAGAGLSGLALAAALDRRGVDYLLVEARNRVGGRILSVESERADLAPGCFDLGPSWVWPGQPRIARLLEELGIGVFEQYSEGRLVYQDETGRVRRDYDFSTMAGSLRVAGGMSSVTRCLCERLPEQTILLSHAVSSVGETATGFVARIKTTAKDKTILARKIVLCVPPRVVVDSIDCGSIFSDAVRASLCSIPTWMAGHAKLLALYEKPFWREMGLSGDGISRRGPLMEIHDASPANAASGALFGFVGLPAGTPARETDNLVAAALAQLQAMFGPAAADAVDVIVRDWRKEAFTATGADGSGAQHPRYGMPEALLPLTHRGLLFASTEMAPQFGGFVEGALEAAEIALEKLQTG